MTIAVFVAAGAGTWAEDSSAGAQQIWTTQCAKCHGKTGAGDTPMGKMIKAANFTEPAIQAKYTDEQMFKTIKEGVKDAKGKFTMVPAENVTEDQIKALIMYIRAFKK